MACGGCGKKKKVSKLPPDYLAHQDYRKSVLNNFMAARKNIIKKES